MTLLLESVAGVDKAVVSFVDHSAHVRAHGSLCTSSEAQTRLLYSLERGRYGGSVTAIQLR